MFPHILMIHSIFVAHIALYCYKLQLYCEWFFTMCLFFYRYVMIYQELQSFISFGPGGLGAPHMVCGLLRVLRYHFYGLAMSHMHLQNLRGVHILLFFLHITFLIQYLLCPTCIYKAQGVCTFYIFLPYLPMSNMNLQKSRGVHILYLFTLYYIFLPYLPMSNMHLQKSRGVHILYLFTLYYIF